MAGKAQLPTACRTGYATAVANGNCPLVFNDSVDWSIGVMSKRLVSVIDQPSASALPGSESFQTVVPAAYDQVVRGVSFTLGTR